MTHAIRPHLDPEKEQACNTLLGTIHDLLRTDSILKKLIGRATGEELFFFCAVIAYGRFRDGIENKQGGIKHRSFGWFFESCNRVRGQALVLISEETIGVGKKRPKVHFFRCRKEGGTYS